MVNKVEKFSEQYWINRYNLIKFVEKIRDFKDLEKKVSENPFDLYLKDSLFNLKKYISDNRPDFFSDKTFYQIA